MKIAIASGKGGTGKTTIATNLAVALAPEVTLLDCDVEEPNAHLFLNPTAEHREEVGILIPEVDYDKCTFCGRCAEVCAYHALAVVKQNVLVFRELCHGCGSCTLNCPEEAIHEVLNVTGVIEDRRTGNIRFAHGILNIGEAMAVPVIRELKKRIGESVAPSTFRRGSGPAALRIGDQIVILDASPGTSCPVVETMRGSNFVLMVTEPTPFGLHDLRLAVQVARDELGLPVGVVINRDGVGDQGVDDYCAAEGIPILMRIPLDRRIAEAYSDGVPLVEAFPEYRQPFRDLYGSIEEMPGARRDGKGGQTR